MLSGDLAYVLSLMFFPCFGATLVMMVANVTVVSKEFKDRRTIAIGVASTGAGIGNIVIPHFTSWCIDMYDWRGCFILMGGICLQGVVIGALLYSEKQSDTAIETQKPGIHHENMPI